MVTISHILLEVGGWVCWGVSNLKHLEPFSFQPSSAPSALGQLCSAEPGPADTAHAQHVTSFVLPECNGAPRPPRALASAPRGPGPGTAEQTAK